MYQIKLKDYSRNNKIFLLKEFKTEKSAIKYLNKILNSTNAYTKKHDFIKKNDTTIISDIEIIKIVNTNN